MTEKEYKLRYLPLDPISFFKGTEISILSNLCKELCYLVCGYR